MYICSIITNLKLKKMLTKSQIINGIKEVTGFELAEFFVTAQGNLTMTLDGMFVEHTWNKGTFINK